MAKRAPARTTSAFSLGHTKIRATTSRSSPPAASLTTFVTVDTSVADNQLMITPSASRPASLSIPSRSAATRIGGLLLGADAEPEPLDLERVVLLGDLLAGEGVAQEAHDVADLLVGLDERDAVPALDDDVARRPDADGEATGRGVGHRRHALGHARGRAGVGRDDGRAEAQARLPRGGEGERGEGVGAVGLGRPQVGVAEVGELGELVPVGVQRAGQRRGHAGADGQRHRAVSSRSPGRLRHLGGVVPGRLRASATSRIHECAVHGLMARVPYKIGREVDIRTLFPR